MISKPQLRDRNEQLYYEYLIEVLGYDADNKSVKEFLLDMKNRVIPYIDSIARASRLVQEEYPHLRGEKWKKRKKKSVDVKHEILADKAGN